MSMLATNSLNDRDDHTAAPGSSIHLVRPTDDRAILADATPPALPITPAAVAHALRHIRDLDVLASSPLCRLHAIGEPTSLAAQLRATVASALGAHRGAAVPLSVQPRGDVEEGLLADFAAGDAEREAWSILHHRFTAPSRLPAKRIERMGGWSRRTILRRANLGFALLCERLRDGERLAQAAIAPGDAPSGAPRDAPDDAAGDESARTAPPPEVATTTATARSDHHLPLAWQRTSNVLEMANAGSAAGRRLPNRAALRAIAASMLIDHLESALGEAWRV